MHFFDFREKHIFSLFAALWVEELRQDALNDSSLQYVMIWKNQ